MAFTLACDNSRTIVLCSEGLDWNQNYVSNYRAIVLFILTKQTKGMVQVRS